MKNLTVLLLILSAFFACNRTQKTENSTKISTQKENIKMRTIHLTTTEFKTKIFDFQTNSKWNYAGDKPCLVDFYADWCSPCRMLAPILEELAAEYTDKLYIYKVDTEVEQELVKVFNIRSIPSLLFVRKDKQPTMIQGAMGKTDLKQAINEILFDNN
ncbi:MAG: thioredoxin [Paludibacter sp.]|nr:thioredoxin [Paludibacter sp.]